MQGASRRIPPGDYIGDLVSPEMRVFLLLSALFCLPNRVRSKMGNRRHSFERLIRDRIKRAASIFNGANCGLSEKIFQVTQYVEQEDICIYIW